VTPAPHPVTAGNPSSLLPPAPKQSARAPLPGGLGHRGAFRAQGVKQRVYWNGTVYPSISAAAKAAGVSRQAMSEAVTQNRLHSVGKGTHGFKHRCPVAAHGWHWPSQKDAAAALGVTPYVIWSRLNRGTFDRLVLQRLGVKNA
jgi:hypothetical protein